MTRLIVERPYGRLIVNGFGDPESEMTPILFIHPANLRGQCWLDVLEPFSDRQLIVPDLRGFGDSSAAPEYSLELWAEDCMDAVEAMGADRFHVVGGSLGGTVAAYLAGMYPDRVASVMAIGSQLHSPNPDGAAVLQTLETKGVADMFNEIIPLNTLGPNASTFVRDKAINTTTPSAADDVRRVWRAAAAADARTQASAASCPATVVTGEYDTTCTPAQGAAMAETLGRTHRVIPGIGHLPMMEAPDLVVVLLREHLLRAEAEQ
jgi:pimeloyl-ACP methyl ester carboxylesterase